MVAGKLITFLKRALHFVLLLWFIAGIIIGVVLYYPLLYVTLKNPKLYLTGQKIRKSLFNFCLAWGGIKVKQIIEAPLSREKTYIITPNHTSKLDMITLLGKIPIPIIFMGKEEFRNIPLIGIFFKTVDLTVDIHNPTKSAKAYLQAKQKLAEGINITIYPEGTIDRHTPKLSPFRDGAFRLAIEQQVDIIPVTYIGHWELLSDFDKYYFSPGTVIQYIHTPISTQGMTLNDLETLKQRVFNIIANKLTEHGYQQ